MPLDESDSVSEMIEELMRSWKKTGKIGNVTPRDSEHAQEVAAAIAYRKKRGGGRHPDDKED